MRGNAARNFDPLTDEEVGYARQCWEVLGGISTALDVSRAKTTGSSTAFDPMTKTVMLGADALPGIGSDANSRMSMLACLSHELAHAERDAAGIARTTELPMGFLDEAETSIQAATRELVLSRRDRMDLVEDAGDRLQGWRDYMETKT